MLFNPIRTISGLDLCPFLESSPPKARTVIIYFQVLAELTEIWHLTHVIRIQPRSGEGTPAHGEGSAHGPQGQITVLEDAASNRLRNGRARVAFWTKTWFIFRVDWILTVNESLRQGPLTLGPDVGQKSTSHPALCT